MTSPIETTEFQLQAGELKLDPLIETVVKLLRSLPTLTEARAAVSPRFWLAAARSTPDLVGPLVHLQIARRPTASSSASPAISTSGRCCSAATGRRRMSPN